MKSKELPFSLPSHLNQSLFTHSLQLQLCQSLTHLQQIHAHFLQSIRKPLQRQLLPYFLTTLLQLPSCNLTYAHHLFDEIPSCRDPFLWTSFIRYHVRHRHCTHAIAFYSRMHRIGVPPSHFTFSSVLNACARLPAVSQGQQVHKRLLQSGHLNNKIVQTALLDMYAKCGCLADASTIFDGMIHKDIIAFTAIICGYTKMKRMNEAQCLFDTMEEHNVISWTAMVAGYANCGNMEAARELYDQMPEKNSVTWVSMIAGYGKCGDVKEARNLFNSILELDASCWAAMLACYAHNGYAKEAIEMYMKMRAAKVKITDVAIVGTVSACTLLGDAALGSSLAAEIEERHIDRGVIVSNALIHMQAKCGSLELAWKEFNRMKVRDVVTYSTMMAALADHGKSQEALDMLKKMQDEGLRPNQVTFVSLLNACSHGGLVEEGCKTFELMTCVYGIKPLAEHVSCMVDLLGRAGELRRAYSVMMNNINVDGMSDAGIWGAFHAACRVHGNAEMGEMAARHLGEMDPEDMGNKLLLANSYASNSKWHYAEKVRKTMIQKRLERSPGCSWILT
ncbi:Putative pentatricopeptide repeat-containing protein At5g37570 [Linum grandiflorum]